MKKILSLIIALATLLSPIAASAQTVTFPNRGGTGTTTIPSLGQVLVGQSNGTYGPQATSTLGLLGTATASSTFVPYTGATSAVNLGSQTFTTTGKITGSNASTTNLSVTMSLYNTTLTSGRVPYITTAGRFIDNSTMTFNGNFLTIPALVVSNLTGGPCNQGGVPLTLNGGGVFTSEEFYKCSSFISTVGLGIFSTGSSRLTFDADGDSFSSIGQDGPDEYGWGANSVVYRANSPGYGHVFVNGEDPPSGTQLRIPYGTAKINDQALQNGGIDGYGKFGWSTLGQGADENAFTVTDAENNRVAFRVDTNDGTVIINEGGGYTAIGKRYPDAPLNIAGFTHFDNPIGIGVNPGGADLIQLQGSGNLQKWSYNGGAGNTWTQLITSGGTFVLTPTDANDAFAIDVSDVTKYLQFDNTGLLLGTASKLKLGQSGVYTALSLNSLAGALQVDNGTNGQWRDLIVRNLSLGTTSTTTLLTVLSTSTKDIISVASTTATGGSSFLVSKNGAVGINTGTLGTNQFVVNVGGTDRLWTNSSGHTAIQVGRRLILDGTVGQYYLYDTSNSTILGAGGSDRLYILGSNGNVGIGTSTPTNKLEVAGSGYFSGSLTAGNITATGTLNVTGLATFGNASTTAVSGTTLCISTDCRTAWPTAGGGTISTSTALANTQIVYATGLATVGSEAAFTYDSSTDRLTVVHASTTNITASGFLNVAGASTLATFTASGASYVNANMGINTTDTSRPLTVGQATTGTFSHFGGNMSNSDGNCTGITMGILTGGSYMKTGIAQVQRADGNNRGDFAILNNNTANSTNVGCSDIKLSVKPDGKVGIGTTTPSTILDIVGGFYSEMVTPATSTTMTLDFTSGNNQKIVVGTANITVNITNASSALGKCNMIYVVAPASGVIGTTTFAGSTGSGSLVWNGGINPGSSVVNGSTDVFSICSMASSTPFIGASLVGTY